MPDDKKPEESLERKLHLLETMNPNVITKDGAELCKWAAATIRRLTSILERQLY